MQGVLLIAALLAGCAPRGVEVVVAEPLVTRIPLTQTNTMEILAPTFTEAEPTDIPTGTTPPPSATPSLIPASDWAGVDPRGQAINLWHSLSYAREDDLQQIIQRFNRTNEWGITLRAEFQGDSHQLFDRTNQVLNTQDAPQLVLAYQEDSTRYWEARGLVELNSLVGHSEWGYSRSEQEDFFPGVWVQDVIPLYSNPRLGIPAYRAMDVLYYNADWLVELKEAGRIDFAGPPLTHAQFRAAACAAVEQPFSKSRKEMGAGYQLSTSASRFASWSFAFGGEVFDPQEQRYTFDSPEAVEAMQFLQGLFSSGCASLVEGSYGDQDDFAKGDLLFTVGTSSGRPFYAQAVKKGAGFVWGVAALPHTSETPRQNVYGPSLSLLKSNPEKELAGWLFIRYFSGPDAQAEWATRSNYYPVRQSAREGMESFFAKDPGYEQVFQLLPYGKFEPNLPGYDRIRRLVSEALAAVAAGAEVQATLQRLNAQANEILLEQISSAPMRP